MPFLGLYIGYVAIIGLLLQYIGLHALLESNALDSGAPLILSWIVLSAGLVTLIRRRSKSAVWLRILAGLIGVVVLAVPPAWVYLEALGRAFQH